MHAHFCQTQILYSKPSASSLWLLLWTAVASNQLLLATHYRSQWAAASRHVYAGESIKCARILMSPQIVFKQSTRESGRKLNFESVNQHTLSSLSKSNHRWPDQSALPGFSALQMQSASTYVKRLPAGFCMHFVHGSCCCCVCAVSMWHFKWLVRRDTNAIYVIFAVSVKLSRKRPCFLMSQYQMQ